MDAIPYVDWSVAAGAGAALVPPGPALGPGEVADVVARLRIAAERATALVQEASEIAEPAAADLLVVDRPSWIAANVEMAAAVVAPPAGIPRPRGLGGRVAGRLLGLEAAVAFAGIATRILGQFEPFGPTPRLLLVAPNIVAVERSLGVPADDFRLWVCLHEQTHRFQFGAAPWLRDHLLRALRAALDAPGGAPRRSLDDLVAVMSLLEGHADVVMDRAAASVLPGVGRLRDVFERRRDRGGLQRLVGRLFGLEVKLAQYRRGAAFCRAVLAAGGPSGLNRAFAGPECLPTGAELDKPERWLDRVAG